MPLTPTLFAAASAFGFRWQSLVERRLQEHGLSVGMTFWLQSYAFIPAVIWSFFYVTPAQLAQIWNTPELTFAFLFLALTWNAQGFLSAFLLNKTSSMSVIALIQELVYLPLILAIGTFYNHDEPGIASFGAMGLLGAALFLQPTQHTENKRVRYALPFLLLLGLAVLRASFDAANNGLTREVLRTFPAESFLGIFVVLTLGLTACLLPFLPRAPTDAATLKKRRWLALGVPLIWFLATIPETYGYAALPIYTMVALGMVAFLFNVFSDLYHRRIHFDARTAGFSVLTLAGLALAAYSV